MGVDGALPAVATCQVNCWPSKASSKPSPVTCPGWSWVKWYTGAPLTVTCVLPSGRCTTPSVSLLTVPDGWPPWIVRGSQNCRQEPVQRTMPPASWSDMYRALPSALTSTVFPSMRFVATVVAVPLDGFDPLEESLPPPPQAARTSAAPNATAANAKSRFMG